MPSTGSRPWSSKEVDAACKIAAQHFEVADAVAAIATKVRPVGHRSLNEALSKAGRGSIIDHLQQRPVERHERAAAESRTRVENKHLVEEIKEHRARWEAIDTLGNGKMPTVKARELSTRKREGCAIILASDWHIEETVAIEASPIRNVYTPAEAAIRVGRFFAGTNWLIRNNRPVFGLRDVLLWLGGDLLTGYIHDELRESNALSPTEALLWLKAHIIAGIESMLVDGEIARLLVVCSYGNHGRTTLKPRRGTGGKNSWEWLLYMDLAKHFTGNKRVSFTVEQSAHQYARVYDFDLHFHHGDECQYGGGVGGITIPINKAVSQWDKVKRCHYHHFGHFHQYLDLGQTVVNGSLIGYNAYAMSIKATPEQPQQAFYILDKKRGKTCKSPVWVTE
jgi:hypothetical protein